MYFKNSMSLAVVLLCCYGQTHSSNPTKDKITPSEQKALQSLAASHNPNPTMDNVTRYAIAVHFAHREQQVLSDVATLQRYHAGLQAAQSENPFAFFASSGVFDRIDRLQKKESVNATGQESLWHQQLATLSNWTTQDDIISFHETVLHQIREWYHSTEYQSTIQTILKEYETQITAQPKSVSTEAFNAWKLKVTTQIKSPIINNH